MSIEQEIKKRIRVINDFPIKGIKFQDIFSLTDDIILFKKIINKISRYVKKESITKIAGIEARGFIFASAVSLKCQIPFIPIRKPGKLPGGVVKQKYKLEYGTDQIEIQKGMIKKSDKVLIIDDLIATGGTALASYRLVTKLTTKRISYFFVINLKNLGGVDKLMKKNIVVRTLYNTQG
jgi:adenine phosphoribosyltransferase